MGRLAYSAQCYSIMAAAEFEDRMTIRRPSSTTGPHGGQLPGAPEVLASAVPCRIQSATASERQIAGATQGETAYVVKFPAWQAEQVIEIDARCEIEIAARDGIAAQTLKVVAPMPNQGLWIEVVGTIRA